MPLMLEGREIRTVAVVDDNKSVREAMIEPLQDLGIEPEGITELRNKSTWESKLSSFDGVVTDLELKHNGYSDFNGGVLAAWCRQKRIPAIVCTSYDQPNKKLLRRERRNIPTIIPLQDLRPIKEAFRISIGEINGTFLPERRPYRAQVQITGEDDGYVWVIIMGRSPQEKTSIYKQELPEDIRSIKDLTGRILHATVNLGAKSSQDLYFDDWESS